MSFEMKRGQGLRASLLSAVMVGTLGGGHASAATLDAVAADATEDIVVTGTRVSDQSAKDSLVPVQVLSAADLQETGKTNLRDALQQLLPSYNNAGGWTGGSGEAVKSASLRGLPGDQVLVLVDGIRRHASSLLFVTAQGNAGSSPVDLDLIPASAVDHIEVLSDGASAQYGSDAVAGVINVILKKGADGGSGSLTYGQYADSAGSGTLNYKGESVHALLDQGLPLLKGGFVRLFLDVVDQDPTNQIGAAYPLGTKLGGASPLQTQFYPNGDSRNLAQAVTGQSQGLPLNNTYNGGYTLEQPLSDAVTAYSFFNYADQYARNYGLFRPAASPQNVPSIFPNGYLPQFIVHTADAQGAIGLKGDVAGITWDLATTYSNTDANERNNNTLNVSLGPASPIDFNNGHLIGTEWTTTLNLSKPVETGLFAVPLAVSGGFEYPRDTFQEVAGQLQSYEQGNYTYPASVVVGSQTVARAGAATTGGASGLGGFDPSSAGSYDRTNFATYLDLEQKKIWDVLDIDVAGRFEHYSDVGDVEIGKLSARYAVLPELAIRGSLSDGLKAPSLAQEHYQSTLPNIVTVGTGASAKTVLANSLYVSPTSKVGEALGGTPLAPESSKDITAGIVAEPIDHSELTADFYRIFIDDRILQTALGGAASNASNNLVNSILTPLGYQPGTAVTYFSNLANTRSEGIDIAGRYLSEFGAAGAVKWSVSSAFNWQSIIGTAAVPGVLRGVGINPLTTAVVNNITALYPKNRTTLGALWTLDNWAVNLRESRYSKTALVVATTNPAVDTAYNKPAFITDLDVTYNLPWNSSITVGAENLFNRFPTKLTTQQALDNGWYGSSYNLSSPFGYNGGYYYVRFGVSW